MSRFEGIAGNLTITFTALEEHLYDLGYALATEEAAIGIRIGRPTLQRPSVQRNQSNY